MDGFSALLRTLGLSQGLFKPVPSSLSNPGDFTDIGTVTPTLNPGSFHIANSTASYNNSHPPLSLGSHGATTIIQRRENKCDNVQYNSPDVGYQKFPPYDQTKANVFRYRQQQSVNLGSWFVHENWMTPSVFACAAGQQAAELDIATGWGSSKSARAVLERHWDTFIKQSDFEFLASIGINTVRLPIGYWNLGPSFCQDTPFSKVADVYQHSWPRIVRAINMAAKSDIGVLVDLHGAVGSQNGQPHSGISDGEINLFGSQSNIEQTTHVLEYLMQQLVNVTNVVGIQILNEPQNVPELANFYTSVISSMRQITGANPLFPLYLHDGFDLGRFSDFVADRSDFIVQDHHSYFVFTPSDEQEPATAHIKDIKGSVTDTLVSASDHQRRNLVVDEFSCALTADSLAHESDPDGARRAFCTGQLGVYANATAGWSFWSYNKEGCKDDPGWCFKDAVGNSLPESFHSYGQPHSATSSQLKSLSAMEAKMLPSFKKKMDKRDLYDGMDMTPKQRSVAKGYSDGFQTARIFATYNTSKLGFTAQYISDSIWTLGPTVVAPGTEEVYRHWFMSGLQDGESLVVKTLKSS